MEYIKRYGEEYERGYHNLGNNKFLIASHNPKEKSSAKYDLFYLNAEKSCVDKIAVGAADYAVADNIIMSVSYVDENGTEKVRVNEFYDTERNRSLNVPEALKYADNVDLIKMKNYYNAETLFALAKVTKGFKENFVAFRYSFRDDVIEGVYSSVLGGKPKRDKTVEEIIKDERNRECDVLYNLKANGIEIHDKTFELTLEETDIKYYIKNK